LKIEINNESRSAATESSEFNEIEMLSLVGVSAGYGQHRVVKNVNLVVPKSKLVSIIGLNGAGKSTVLKSVLGLNRLFSGEISVDGVEITRLRTHERVKHGMGYVPQGRQVFPDLTTYENLVMGGFLHKHTVSDRVEEMFVFFPRLRERSSVSAGALSGGEQQMLAMARALMMKPKILILDEPTLGLAPALVEQVMEKVLEMRNFGYSMLMVEQNATLALEISDFAYLVDSGTSSQRFEASKLLESEEVGRKYLGRK
jgi:branched-chain amino acid transport system ATP-binding protein